ncbi:MAG TPA: bifunctional [glutamine synthetase] adenylyltransferase/[glutamine synthetase]-adenylyl-L-tyrosine phosphorylase, partial [Propionibacteriaceae bacterium]|nr:bifunctional [glutamine synthetase] adenylyltransferase/[glutamine synthetase]-adenylyl-L-tyrosine phosphorylase [Propionibacteriaceae bacterium]
MTRLSSTAGELARRGFHDPDAAHRHLQELPPQAPDFLDLFDGAADPDLALMGVVALAHTPEYAALASDHAALSRLIAVLGGSIALNHHLAQRPADLAVFLRAPTRHRSSEIIAEVLGVIGAPDVDGVATAPDATDRLRLVNKRELCRIAARDLTSDDPFAVVDDIARELAALANALMAGALCTARAEVPDHADARLSIIALGKCGARELNYISDVDVLFVAEPARDDVTAEQATRVATKLAAATTRICSTHTATGTIWQVDAGLRPEGKAGPLVRSLASMRSYYGQWASNWEYQAMLKARPMAGDADLGRAFVEIVCPLVWQAGERENFISESQAMRKRVISLIPPKEAEREIKLSSGGLRDVEFSVQLLQLVHGRADARLRLRSTLPALDALVANGYVGRSDGAELASAYRLQRALEHRVQLHRLRRTHLMPDDERGMRMLARGLGFRTSEDVVEAWRASSIRVQRLHQRVFYSPVLEAVARIHTTELRLSPEAARARLKALGFQDPAAALRHIEALTHGRTRAKDIQRQLMPAMLGWFAEDPNPDHGLLSFRKVSEALGTTPWYLRALRDEGQMAEHLAHILASSRYAVGLLTRAPETVQLLVDESGLVPRGRGDLSVAMLRAAERHDSETEAFASVRAQRRKELLRLAIADLLHVCDEAAIGAGLADLAGATIDAALAIAARSAPGENPVGVVAMGRWGGREMSHGSDADAMFVI